MRYWQIWRVGRERIDSSRDYLLGVGDSVDRALMNLLTETVEMLDEVGRSSADVEFVSWKEFYCSWPEFETAADFEYDSGYGGAEVEVSLRVVGKDWWLERGEYDGSEWWEFKTLPEKPNLARVPIAKDLQND